MKLFVSCILIGAHTIGQSHCSSFSSRLYNFSPNSSTDPTLNSTLASQLIQKCPQNNTNPNTTVSMDPVTPNTFDVKYYQNLLSNNGLFTSDQTLMSSSATSSLVTQYAQNSQTFMSKFAAAMVKMGNIDVLTGTNGQIRTWCHVTNWWRKYIIFICIKGSDCDKWFNSLWLMCSWQKFIIN